LPLDMAKPSVLTCLNLLWPPHQRAWDHVLKKSNVSVQRCPANMCHNALALVSTNPNSATHPPDTAGVWILKLARNNQEAGLDLDMVNPSVLTLNLSWPPPQSWDHVHKKNNVLVQRCPANMCHNALVLVSTKQNSATHPLDTVGVWFLKLARNNQEAELDLDMANPSVLTRLNLPWRPPQSAWDHVHKKSNVSVQKCPANLCHNALVLVTTSPNSATHPRATAGALILKPAKN